MKSHLVCVLICRFRGIQVILGNHLAGADMLDVAPPSLSPVAVSMPSTGVASPGRQSNSMVGPACVVTRSQGRADHHTGKRVKEELKSSSNVCFPLPDFLLPVTHRELVQEQENDSSLNNLFNQVCLADESETATKGYFREDGLLV